MNTEKENGYKEFVATFIAALDAVRGNVINDANIALAQLKSRLNQCSETLTKFEESFRVNPQYAFHWSEKAQEETHNLNFLSSIWCWWDRADSERTVASLTLVLRRCVDKWTCEHLENLRPMGCSENEYVHFNNARRDAINLAKDIGNALLR